MDYKVGQEQHGGGPVCEGEEIPPNIWVTSMLVYAEKTGI